MDASGARLSADKLDSEDVGRWLWFEAGVIPAVAHRRGGSLHWHTRDTGTVTASHGYGVHFGVNSKSLITVYAHDIARLPEWQQRIWMGFNISPDGKVCAELLAAQMEAKPASTDAPEAFLDQTSAIWTMYSKSGLALRFFARIKTHLKLFRERTAFEQPTFLRCYHWRKILLA